MNSGNKESSKESGSGGTEIPSCTTRNCEPQNHQNKPTAEEEEAAGVASKWTTFQGRLRSLSVPLSLSLSFIGGNAAQG